MLCKYWLMFLLLSLFVVMVGILEEVEAWNLDVGQPLPCEEVGMWLIQKRF